MRQLKIFLWVFSIFLSNCSAQQGNLEKAIELNNKGIELSHNTSDSVNLFFALDYFNKAIEQDSTYILGYYNKTNTLVKLKMYEEALNVVAVVRKYSDDLGWLTIEANIYELKKERTKAEDIYKKLYSEITPVKKKEHIIYFLLLTEYYYGETEALKELNVLSEKFSLSNEEVESAKEILTYPTDSKLPFQ